MRRKSKNSMCCVRLLKLTDKRVCYNVVSGIVDPLGFQNLVSSNSLATHSGYIRNGTDVQMQRVTRVIVYLEVCGVHLRDRCDEQLLPSW